MSLGRGQSNNLLYSLMPTMLYRIENSLYLNAVQCECTAHFFPLTLIVPYVRTVKPACTLETRNMDTYNSSGEKPTPNLCPQGISQVEEIIYEFFDTMEEHT